MNARPWRKQIPGCFAGQTAPFGGHPYDRRRAESMFNAAMCQGASWAEVKSAIEDYLRTRLNTAASLREEMRRVGRFRPNPFLNRRLGSAWLVTLDNAIGPCHETCQVLSVLNYRRSPDQVRKFVEQLYINRFFDPWAQLTVARHRKANSYQAEFLKINGVRWEGRIICGNGPYVIARPVHNVQVSDESRPSSLTWQELEVPDSLP